MTAPASPPGSAIARRLGARAPTGANRSRGSSVISLPALWWKRVDERAQLVRARPARAVCALELGERLAHGLVELRRSGVAGAVGDRARRHRARAGTGRVSHALALEPANGGERLGRVDLDADLLALDAKAGGLAARSGPRSCG